MRKGIPSPKRRPTCASSTSRRALHMPASSRLSVCVLAREGSSMLRACRKEQRNGSRVWPPFKNLPRPHCYPLQMRLKSQTQAQARGSCAAPQSTCPAAAGLLWVGTPCLRLVCDGVDDRGQDLHSRLMHPRVQQLPPPCRSAPPAVMRHRWRPSAARRTKAARRKMAWFLSSHLVPPACTATHSTGGFT